MCIVSSGHHFLERVSRSKGLITFTMYFLMVGLATIGIFGKTQYPDTFTPRWVNACMISSGLCCVLGLATACLVTNKNVDSQTPDAASGQTAAAAPAAAGPNHTSGTGAQLSQMYNTQVSPVLTVSVLDMDVTTGRSTFLPLIGYPVNHDFNLQLLLPNRYGNAEQILGVHLPQNGKPGQVHQTIVQARHADGKTLNEKTVFADHLKRIAAKQCQDGKVSGELAGCKDNGVSKKIVETPPPSYSSLEISVQCSGPASVAAAPSDVPPANAGTVVAMAPERREQLPQPPQRQPQQINRMERADRPPSYDTALCRLAENGNDGNDEDIGAVGGVTSTIEQPNIAVNELPSVP